MSSAFLIRDIHKATVVLFDSILVESSSDFIYIVLGLYKKFYPKLYTRVYPLHDLEYGNHYTFWADNCVYVENKIKMLNTDEQHNVMNAYRRVLEYFLYNEVTNKIYPMDEVDSLGLQIYKELDAKYNYCRKLLMRKDYETTK